MTRCWSSRGAKLPHAAATLTLAASVATCGGPPASPRPAHGVAPTSSGVAPGEAVRGDLDVVALAQRLIQFDTRNPPGREQEAAAFVGQVLEKNGLTSQTYQAAPGRTNLVARLRGDGSLPPILLTAHLDVVPVEPERWTVPPFAGVIRDGYLYGRGALDNKGSLAAMMSVFLRLHREKLRLRRDVILFVGADEEAGGTLGVSFMLEHHPAELAAEFALNEVGWADLVGDKVVSVRVATSEKVPYTLTVTAQGTAGHGSIARADNPVLHLAAAVGKVGAHTTEVRLNETTSSFFQTLAALQPSPWNDLFRRVSDPQAQKEIHDKLPEYDTLLRTTLVPTLLRAGLKKNVIPSTAEATVDVRALPDEDVPALLQALQRDVGDPAVQLRLSRWGRPHAPPSSTSTAMYRALQRAQGKVFPGAVLAPMVLGAATDSAQLRAHGIAAYGVGPVVTPDDVRRMHGHDERVLVSGLKQYTEFLYQTVTTLE